MQILDTIKTTFNKLKTWQKVLVILCLVSLIMSPFIPDDEPSLEEQTFKINTRKNKNKGSTDTTTTTRKPEKKETKQVQEVKPEKPDGFSIIEQSSKASFKHTIEIRLEKKATKEELEKIGHYLFSQLNKKFDRVFMSYYLSGMEVGSGAYATTHFEGNSINVRILDFMIN